MGDSDVNERTIVERRDPLLGTILDGRFRLDFQIAAGGFGAIYHAHDLRTGTDIALKLLHRKLVDDPEIVERFRREAVWLSSLRDPHTVRALELGATPDGTLYIAMELLHGESLFQRFRSRGKLPWRQVVHIARGVCSSLAEAHAAGVVHRDLKPANIHLEELAGDPDFVKVLDFGIAKIMQDAGGDESELTQAGQMIGTLDYMSPEQMVGGELTGRSDIYTLGVVMYEMISGRTPFADAQTATAILGAVLTQAPDLLSQHAQVPALLDHIVARCIEREARNRFASVGELSDALVALVASDDAAAQPRFSGYATAPYPALIRAPRAASPPLVAPGRLPQPAPAVAPSPTGFEHSSPTSEATRLDVRHLDSSEPVLDARGPRYRPGSRPRPDELGGDTPAPRALGSNHALGGQLAIPTAVSAGQGSSPVGVATGAPPHRAPGTASENRAGRGSQPWLEGWPRTQLPDRGLVSAHNGGHPVPAMAGGRGYDMTAATARDALVRRIIWIAVLAIAASIALAVLAR